MVSSQKDEIAYCVLDINTFISREMGKFIMLCKVATARLFQPGWLS